MDALLLAVGEVKAVLCGLANFDGSRWTVSRLKNGSVLRGRGDADVEGNSSSIDPVLHVDVGRARESPWDEARHLFTRVERSVLGHPMDFVPNTIMAATFHATIVAAVEGVVTEAVLLLSAGRGAAVTILEKWQAEAVPHRHPKGPGVHIERERWRPERVEPVAGVRKSERVEAGFVAKGGRGEEERFLVSMEFGGEGVLSG